MGRARARARSFSRWLRTNPAIPLEVQRRYTSDRGGALGATITYNAFLSLFPLLLLSLALIGFVVTDPAARQEWVERIAGSIPGLRPVIEGSLTTLADDRATVGIIGLATLAWTGTNVVRAAGAAMNRVFEVPEHGGLRSLVWALATLGALGAVALSSVAASAFIAGIGNGNTVMLVVAAGVAVALDVVLFLMAYRLLTHRKGPQFGDLWQGALFAGIGWTVLKGIGVWYATRTVANATAVYGTFAATVGVLVMLSLGSRIFLYGAELNAVLVERKRGVGIQKAINLSRHREMRRRASV